MHAKVQQAIADCLKLQRVSKVKALSTGSRCFNCNEVNHDSRHCSHLRNTNRSSDGVDAVKRSPTRS